jgi:hypothetical protein
MPEGAAGHRRQVVKQFSRLAGDQDPDHFPMATLGDFGPNVVPGNMRLAAMFNGAAICGNESVSHFVVWRAAGNASYFGEAVGEQAGLRQPRSAHQDHFTDRAHRGSHEHKITMRLSTRLNSPRLRRERSYRGSRDSKGSGICMESASAGACLPNY